MRRGNLFHRGFTFTTDTMIENFGLADDEVAVFSKSSRFLNEGWERELIKNNLSYAYALIMDRCVTDEDLLEGSETFKPFEETGLNIEHLAILYESDEDGYERLTISLSKEEREMFQEILEGHSPESNKFEGNNVEWSASIDVCIDGTKKPFESLSVDMQTIIRNAIGDGLDKGSFDY